jgi:hypothetical protein
MITSTRSETVTEGMTVAAADILTGKTEKGWPGTTVSLKPD